MVFAVLDNDKDADGNKLKSYLYLHQRMVPLINENDTITFEPSTDFVGTDKFSYVIADSEGNTDEGKVSADVRRGTDDKQPDVPRQPSSSKALNMNPL